MKKMLDELKKLDVEYEVPKGFSKRVLERIKLEENVSKTENNKEKISYFTKYVIPWTTAAAVLLIVVLVTFNGSSMEKTESDFAVNIASNSESVLETTINGAMSNQMAGAVSKNEFNVFDNVFREDISMDAELKTESDSFLEIRTIEKILDKNDIKYNIEDETIILTNETIEFVELILENIIDKIEITEEENIIKINLK